MTGTAPRRAVVFVSRILPLLMALAVVFATVRNVFFVQQYADTLAPYNLTIDTPTYDHLAWEIARTGRLSVPINQPPGFIVFLSGMYAVFGHDFLPPKIVFCLMIGVIALGTWWLGHRYVGRHEGIIAGGFVLLSPMFQAYAATLQYEIAITCMFLVTCLLFLQGTQAASTRRTVVLLSAGACGAALCALTREVFLAVFPFLLASVWTSWRAERRGRLRMLLVMIGLFGCIVGSWILWQYYAHGQLAPISSKGPFNFHVGNNPNASGTFNLGWVPVTEPRGWAFIREQPGAALGLAGRKFLYFWGLDKDGWSMPSAAPILLSRVFLGALPLDLLQTIARGVVPLLGFLGMGLVLSRRELRKRLWVFPATIGVLLSVHLVLISSHRFALPVYPYIFLFAAVGLAWIGRRIRRYAGRYVPMALGCGCIWLVGALLVNSPSHFHVEAEDLEGSPLTVVDDPRAHNGVSRFHAPSRTRHLLGLLPQELFPAGFFDMHLSVRSETQHRQEILEILEVVVSTYEQGIVCRRRLSWPADGHGYQRLTASCPRMPRRISRIEVWTLGTASVWLDTIDMEFGLETAPSES